MQAEQPGASSAAPGFLLSHLCCVLLFYSEIVSAVIPTDEEKITSAGNFWQARLAFPSIEPSSAVNGSRLCCRALLTCAGLWAVLSHVVTETSTDLQRTGVQTGLKKLLFNTSLKVLLTEERLGMLSQPKCRFVVI